MNSFLKSSIQLWVFLLRSRFTKSPLLVFTISLTRLLGQPMSHLFSNTFSLCGFACCCLVSQSCLPLCDPIDCSMPRFPVLHYLPEFAQTHVHWVSDAIQPSHPLLPPSPPALCLSQHQVLFQWVRSSHQVAKIVELQLQYQSCQWIFRLDLL